MNKNLNSTLILRILSNLRFDKTVSYPAGMGKYIQVEFMKSIPTKIKKKKLMIRSLNKTIIHHLLDSQIKTKSPENKLNHKKENIFVAFNLYL